MLDVLAHPLGNDPALIGGPSAVAGIAAAISGQLDLGPEANVLTILSEGDVEALVN